ncbi:MAG: pyridoxal-phosphate dependent enzyme [Chloroflexi bacterium]|nr:MAG: pyridoxal-phosphate dependent enzyme [Chloroflexota bacterium]MBL1194091.1 pyridoxal-phosphate dependent enzyme [Chloroflexota bacterium]NOH11385.1 pyridoxal-phosphate dependent enzyme [Chloroflexota bacterium]
MAHFVVECIDCSHQAPYFPTSGACPKCGSTWREARYDYETIRQTLPLQLARRSFDLWRYKELLPVRTPNPELTMGEGGTPLIRAANLGMMLGCPHIYIKDERQGPTASFKDRQAAITIAALKEAGVAESVVASTGNVAISYSAYAARAGLKLWAFITSLVPPVKMREAALYGTQVVKVTGNYEQAKKVAADFAKQRTLYLDQGVRSIPTVESMKTVAFEIAEQLTQLLGPPTDSSNGDLPPTASLRSPDWYVQAVSGGLGPIGVMKGFDELELLGLSNSSPKYANVQAEGCAPMVQAWNDGEEVATPVITPRTHIATLATGDPGRTYTLLRERMLERNGGTFESVTDEEAFHAMHVLAKMEGISVEPATAVAFAGLFKMVRAGLVDPSDVIVVNCTGHTVPVEQSVLGDKWAYDVEYQEAQAEKQAPEDGLLAALNHVTADRYQRIAIVDDHPQVRQLIRRILQAQGEYALFEAEDGQKGIKLIRDEKPDLVILDLMMPELDGFGVLDEMKGDPDLASIPVVVVTAKELTSQEKERLSGQIDTLMQKGDFMSDELMEEVRSLTN